MSGGLMNFYVVVTWGWSSNGDLPAGLVILYIATLDRSERDNLGIKRSMYHMFTIKLLQAYIGFSP